MINIATGDRVYKEDAGEVVRNFRCTQRMLVFASVIVPPPLIGGALSDDAV